MKALVVLPLVLVGAVLTSSSAQTPPPSSAPPPPAETRQFDFWVGEWTVTTPDGREAGINKIELVSAGRALLEQWAGRGGFTGRSLNTYNPAKRQWQQFWVGSDGTILELAGGLDPSGSMVLSDATNRIRWTLNADGSVRQFWETTKDGGKTWTVAFDGKYVRKPAGPALGQK